MKLDEYIELDRQFINLSKQQVKLTDFEVRMGWGSYNFSKWSDLLQSYRVVLLSSAGTGKSWEISYQCHKLNQQGPKAFYIRLEDLAEGISETVFEQGNLDDLQKAIKCGKEIWLFLDSVDEARLSNPRKFEIALKWLKPEIKDNLHNTHLILTSRAGAWRPNDDANRLDNLFPYKYEEQHGSRDKAPPSSIKYYTLRPLTIDQIKTYVQGKKVEKADDLIEEIDRKQMVDLVGRPKDLDDIVHFWKSQKRLGSRLEMIKDSIKRKLEEYDPDRSNYDSLTPSKAWDGATKLAASVTLSHQGKIIVPDSESIDGITADSVLIDWTNPECTTLLGRPIFEPETYGFVRFDHRDSKEFLAAEWFMRLLQDQRHCVEVLFLKNQYGVDVVTPSLRPILPWIAISDSQIKNRLIRDWPEILLEGGDPASLHLEDRKSLLKKICKKFAKPHSLYSSIDQNSLHRLISKDMAPVIRSLVNKYAGNDKITHLLMRSIELGLLKDLSDLAIKSAEAEEQDEYVRLAAMRAVNAVAQKEKIDLTVQNLVKNKCLKNRSILAHFINSFDHEYIPPGMFVKLISNVNPPKEHRTDGLIRAIQVYISECPLDWLKDIVEEAARHLKTKPFIERRHFEVSKDHAWMLNYAVPACERLVNERHKDAFLESTLSIMSLVNESIGYGSLKEKTNLPTSIPAWSELNEKLFWHDVADARRIRKENDGTKLTCWRQVRSYRNVWGFSKDDLDHVIDWITKRPSDDEQLVALSLAFTLYVKVGRPRKIREQLWKSVNGNKKLSDALKRYMKPPRQTPEQKKDQRSEARWKRKIVKLRAEQDACHENWKEILPKNLSKIRNEERAKKDHIWNEQLYLFDRMGDNLQDRNRYARSNCDDLIEEYGQEVAEAMREGLKATWRDYEPGLLSENTKETQSSTGLEIFGLSGLEIEASECPEWPSNLSEDDAYRAARYLMSELNGFPKWFRSFADNFPEITRKQIIAEIEWELLNSTCEQPLRYILSDIFYHAPWYEVQIAKDLLNVLQSNNPKHLLTLQLALSILLRCKKITDQEITDLAVLKINEESLEINQKPLWYAAWVSVKPESAIERLRETLHALDKAKVKESSCDPIQDPARDFAINFINALSGARIERSLYVRDKHLEVKYLVQLYELMHQYIRKEEDLNRFSGKAFTPTSRDDAQEGRERLFFALCDIPGQEAFNALVDIAESEEDEFIKAWIDDKAITRAQADADKPWTIEEINNFEKTLELITPNTQKELFDVAVNRLHSLKDVYEKGDYSPSKLLIKVEKENELRNFLAYDLEKNSLDRFSISQEDEFPNKQRTDLRFMHTSITGMVPVELKIADSWTGNQLFEKLRNQLCRDYLRDPANKYGIYLLVYRGEKKGWVVSGKKLNFEKLINSIAEYATELTTKDPIVQKNGVAKLQVIGIDLTKRAVKHQKT